MMLREGKAVMAGGPCLNSSPILAHMVFATVFSHEKTDPERDLSKVPSMQVTGGGRI